MKILGTNEISFEKHSISEVSVIRQTNSWSICTQRGRALNGFLLIVGGACVYKWKGMEAHLSPGSIIYLPKGSVHSVTAPERTLDFYRVSFTITERESGEEIVFSALPRVISAAAPKSAFDICEQLRRETLKHHTDFLTASLICGFLDYVAKTTESHLDGIDTAIEYVKNHYTEEISVQVLSEVAFMSEPHLFRLFKQRTGFSPIEYKNSLRIQKAESLLPDPFISIGEIADLLGFENACYFSRIFKRINGLSPIEYRKQRMKK